jgi:hypothetical protein
VGFAQGETMFRFLLIVIVLAGVGLALTNPTTEDVRAKLDSQLLSQLTGGASNPVAEGLNSVLGNKAQEQIKLERTNYYVFSTYKVTLTGKTLPGCVIGIAQQAIPYDKC